MDKAKKDGKPFFVWHNTTRMHAWTFLSPKYKAMQNYESNYGLEEGGMAQMDDSIGALLKHIDDIGETNNTIVIFTTDNGAQVFTWPDGGMTPFKSTKGTSYEGGFRVPAIIRWPGRIKPGSVENGVFSGLDWLPTLAAAAGNPNITEQLLKGVTLGGRNYKNHLDGYNQMDLLTGEGPSARREIFYFAGPHLGALRIDDFKYQFFVQPNGWPGEKTTTDMPSIINIRQDPFERTPSNRGESLNDSAGGYPRASTLTPLRDRSRKRSSLAREISFSSQLSGLCSGYQQDVRHWPPSTTTLKPLSCRLSLADRTPIPCCLHRACDPQRTS